MLSRRRVARNERSIVNNGLCLMVHPGTLSSARRHSANTGLTTPVLCSQPEGRRGRYYWAFITVVSLLYCCCIAVLLCTLIDVSGDSDVAGHFKGLAIPANQCHHSALLITTQFQWLMTRWWHAITICNKSTLQTATGQGHCWPPHNTTDR